MNKKGKLLIIGFGPGRLEHITGRALAALEESEAVIGYTTYVDLIKPLLRHQEIVGTGMTEEVSRAQEAVRRAEAGQTIAVISSGDAGVYGMAGLVYEVLIERGWNRVTGVEVEVIPGISAIQSCSSLLGAPIMHDSCTISLSDHLTPWESIAARVEAAGAADFVIAFYNPRSGKRIRQIEEARQILLCYRDPSTPVGIVKSAYRDRQQTIVTTLQEMLDHEIGMLSTVIVGNSATMVYDGLMVTPRGYERKYSLGADTQALKPHERLRTSSEPWSLAALNPTGNVVKVKTCGFCDMRKESAAGAARRLHQQLNGRLVPRELQISVAGCGVACSSAVLEDIGLVYSKGSYELYLGGKKTGRTPHAGSKVREGMNEGEAVAAVTEVVEQYCAQGSQNERFYTFFERMGSGISADYPQAESVLHCEHTHTYSHNHEKAQGITTVLLVGHGSRVEEGNEELRNFTRALAVRKPELAIETCFIELSSPSISEGIDKCVLGGAGTVYVVPIILFAAGHSKLDIPLALDQAKLKYPGVEFIYGRPLGVQERAVEILLDRIAGAVPQPVQVSSQPELPGDRLEETLLLEHGSFAQQDTGGQETAAALSAGVTASAADRGEPCSKVRDEDTIVLVMGRGGSDPDANSDFCKLARLLWERTPYKSVETCFIAITKPSLPAGLERCLALGARKIIVLPYLLFRGVLMKQFNETVNHFAAAHPEIEVEAGTYLGSHPLLSDMLLERIEETLTGRTAANCDNCMYREEASAHHHHHHHHDDHHDHHSHGEEGDKSGHRSQPAPADADGGVPPQPGASYSEDAVHPASAPEARRPR